jgi:ketosteroid isomerase-like protein
LVPQPGQVVNGTAAIREALLGFLALKLPISLERKRVLAKGEVALVSSTWSISGAGPDGSAVNLGGNTTEVVRRQSDGSWRYVIDDPFSIV